MDFFQALIDVVTGGQMVGLVALLVANMVLSIAAAIKNSMFMWGEFGNFVTTRIWPLIAWIVVAGLLGSTGEWAGIANLVYVGIIAIYTRGILAGLKSLTGLPIPDVISEKGK